jgi:hypothetical protein
MIENGAYGERMAKYLHLNKPPMHATLGFGRSELVVTRLHAPNGFSDPTSLFRHKRHFRSICIFARTREVVYGSRANWFPPANDLREE